ncbi:MAG: metal-sensitive transcriptional regulator [Anaerolineae bacterium]|nr:metal-sensitive transcriptional regulator [Anaerolineae bacterium]MEB2286524.1 metal-sensitive transcriptional regulator [Anaerolineae bacterium]
MDNKTQTEAIHRLKSVAGHVNGIIRMLEDDRYCIDVIKQIQATQTALARVSESILEAHLRTCVTTAIQGDDVTERERLLSEVVEVYRHTNKP